MNKVPVMTIDGPSGSGKGTVSRAAARALGWALLDSGALYRLVALAGRRAGVNLDDGLGLAQLAQSSDIRFDSGDAGRILVRSGLSPNARVVLEPSSTLRDGMAASVTP